MAIVFGWNSFKIRDFTLEEIGIHKKAEPGITLEVRQAYFFFFWVPFFGLGKRWVVRKGDKTYEMPDEIKTLAKKTLTNVKTPWYTYAGPLAIVLSIFLFWVFTEYEQMQSHKRSVAAFNAQTEVLKYKLQHITTNDFITVQEKDKDDYSGTTLYLKVEDIKGDEILVTPVEVLSQTPMIIEEQYNKYAGSTPSVKLSYKTLLAGLPTGYDAAYGPTASKQAVNLLNDQHRYLIRDVVRHFGPIIKDGHTGFYGSDASLRFYNEGWPATITAIKTLVGSADWSENINKEFPGSQSEYNSNEFFLTGKNFRYGEPYKFVMTLKDTAGHVHQIEVEGNKKDKIIKEI
jgi:hypothetical protein